MCAQSCPTLCDPMDCSPPGSSVHGTLQTRILEWIAIPSSGDLPNPGIEPTSLTSSALAARFFTTGATCEALKNMYMCGEPGVGSWEKLFCPGQIPFLTGLLSLSPTAVFLCDASHLLLPRSNAAFSKKLSLTPPRPSIFWAPTVLSLPPSQH